ncbi:MAG: secretin N-terminal domain-containing protein, partial [Burkholderiales bacterium]
QSLLPPLAVELPKLETADAGPRFDLAVTNAPAPQVLNAIVAGTRFSMVVHPDIKAPISLNLKDVTITDVLSSVREIYGYEYKIEGTRIFVLPAALQTRMFKVDHLTLLRRGSSDIRVSSNTINAVTGSGTTPGAGTPGVGAGAGTAGVGAAQPGAAGAQPGLFGAQLGMNTVAQGAQNTQMATTSTSDFWSELRTTLAALMGCAVGYRFNDKGELTQSVNREEVDCRGGRRLVISPQSGTVVARAMPDELKTVADYLRASQISLDKQILIEAKILEVALKDGYETGVNWAKFFQPTSSSVLGIGQLTPGTQLGSTQSGTLLQGGTPPRGTFSTPLTAGVTTTVTDPVTGATTTATFPFGALGGLGQALTARAIAGGSIFGIAFQGTNFAALLSFLETQGVVHTLSSPRIATVNNQKAVLKVGSDALFVTRISSGTGASGTTTTTTVNQIPTFDVQSFFSGIALDVTPHINDDDSIVLHVRPSVSSVTQNLSTFNLGVLGVFTIPLVSNAVSETDSVIRAQDGQIVAIGGLMRQSQIDDRSQVPGLGEAPVIGGAFRNINRSSEKRELVILLKPTIVQSDQTWARNILDTRDRMQALDRGMSLGAEERKP